MKLGDFLGADRHASSTAPRSRPTRWSRARSPPAGLICNAGHPDILTLRESPRKRAFNTKIDFPPPYIPRNRTCEVRGRIDAMGNEIEKLNEKDVVAAAQYLKKCGVAGGRGLPALVDRQPEARAAGARDPEARAARTCR